MGFVNVIVVSWIQTAWLVRGQQDVILIKFLRMGSVVAEDRKIILSTSFYVKELSHLDLSIGVPPLLPFQ